MDPGEEHGFVGELRFGRELGALETTVVGISLFVPIVLILAPRIAELAGPAGSLSFVLAGVLFTLSLLSYLELLLASHRRGASYFLMRRVVGGLPAFLTGWTIFLGFLVLSTLLSLFTAEHLALLFNRWFALQLPIRPLAALVVVVSVIDDIIGRRRARQPRTTLYAGALILLIVVLLGSILQRTEPGNQPFAPYSLSGATAGAALAVSAFAGLEAIAQVGERIHSARRNLPRAFSSTLIVGVVLGALATVAALPLINGDSLALSRVIATYRGRLIPDLIAILATFLAFYGLNTALMAATRHGYLMSRDGSLPPVLATIHGRFGTPHRILSLMGVTLIGLISWAREGLMLELSALAFLGAMTAVPVAVLLYHRQEREEPFSFELPFHPLFPALAISGNVLGALLLPGTVLLTGLGWISCGAVVYFAYARHQQIEAKEGITVFKQPDEEEERPNYRVLVPLGSEGDRRSLIRLGTALARQRNGDVVALSVIDVPDQLAFDEAREMARERNVLFQWSMSHSEQAGVPIQPITRISRSVAKGIVDTAVEEDCDLILLNWRGEARARSVRLGRVLDRVIENAPCDVAVVRGKGWDELQRILIPTAGGPHAPAAVGLALTMARAYGARVTPLYISRDDTAASQRQGQKYIAATLEHVEGWRVIPGENGEPIGAMEDSEGNRFPVEPKIIFAAQVVDGILEQAKEYDLTILGASEQGIIDQVLFGTVPERIARESTRPVMMVKRYVGLPQFWARRLWRGLFTLFPTLAESDRVDVYMIIRRGARPDIDFFAMMFLATIIATLGLLLNSAAVIIGAMLVAPLMTPMLALSLGIVQGDARLLRLAIESTLKGVLLSIGASFALAAISPLTVVTAEVLSRTQPTLFDLIIALAAGAAGAYAIAREEVGAALPGVAIAAAVVPPLGVVGIGAATGRSDVAAGSLLLFATNLIAISLAGALVFLLLGFRPFRQEEERRAHLRRGLLISLILLFVISIPLATIFIQVVEDTRTTQAIQRTLDQQIEPAPEIVLVDFKFNDKGDHFEVVAFVQAEDEQVARTEAQEIQSALEDSLGREVVLRFRITPITEIEAR